MRYWITYHCSTFDHTRREYGETNNPLEIMRRYYEIAKYNHVLSVDVEGLA
jgi:hypothetical protein